jgi:ABC-type transport system involved in multi-copper enzyme maturation permease subunit
MSLQGGNLSVYKHEYRAYDGPVTPLWSRIGVLARYGFAEAWSSKITVGLFTLSMLPVIVYLIVIYLANNPVARMLIMRGNSSGLAIDASFFLKVLVSQCWLALILTAWIAPRLVSFDLSDNALPILLSHPITRFGFVFGKFIALFSSLSLVTWIPCLLLFAYQGYASPKPWMADNLQVAGGLLAGSMLWIVILSILGLALSSWVKWRVVATGIIFAAVFVPAGVGGVASAILRTKWGLLLNLPVMMTQLWQRLLGVAEFNRIGKDLPNAAIATMLFLICFVCVIMLNARIRAREVVRG